MKILSIDIGGSSIKYGILDENIHISTRGKIKTPSDTLDNFYQAIDSIITENIDGIAISMPGVIDPQNGIAITGGALLYIDNEPIVKKLEKKYHVPVWVGNDAKCAALAEVGYGSLKDVDDAVVIILGTGIGGCLVKNREVHYGKRFSSGEVSSVIVRNDYPLKEENSWYRINGIQGLLETVQRYLDTKNYYTGEQIFEMVNQGDIKVNEALDEFCFNIALQIFNIQAVFDPEKVSIGGGISAQAILIKKVNEQYQKMCALGNPLYPIPIVACEFRNDANLIGAYYQLSLKIKNS